MYLEFFGLKTAPFRITPDTDFWFPGAQRGEILDALIYALSHGEGLIKVVGEVGSGKTLLLRMLLNHLPATVDSLYLANPTLSPDETLAALLNDLGEDVAPGSSRQAMLEQLNRLLLDKHQQGRRVVVLVEEAQGMALESLEFLRLLTNLETARDKLLQIILFGQPELDELLANPRIRQFKDRITLNLNLDPLPPETVPAYLRTRLAAAGYRGPDLFNAKTIRAIARFSGGLGRRINILADKTLLAAFGEQTHNLSSAHVEAAARDAELSRPSDRPKTNWAWIMAGLAAGLGLMGYLAWLGLVNVPTQTPARPKPPVLSAPHSPSPVSAAASQPPEWAGGNMASLGKPAPASILQHRTAKDGGEATVVTESPANSAISRRRGTADAAPIGLPEAQRVDEPPGRSPGNMGGAPASPAPEDPS